MPPGTPTTSEVAFRMFKVIELLRSTGEREFPAQLMSTFFWIAAHDGCRQEDLAKACNLSASSVSRCVTWLGPSHRLEHRSGLRLVRRERDPDNYKAWRLFLTPKGEIFKGLLEELATAPDATPVFETYSTKLRAYDNTNDQNLG